MYFRSYPSRSFYERKSRFKWKSDFKSFREIKRREPIKIKLIGGKHTLEFSFRYHKLELRDLELGFFHPCITTPHTLEFSVRQRHLPANMLPRGVINSKKCWAAQHPLTPHHTDYKKYLKSLPFSVHNTTWHVACIWIPCTKPTTRNSNSASKNTAYIARNSSNLFALLRNTIQKRKK